jgi:hypothetical protein
MSTNTLPPASSHFIDLPKAVDMTTDYRDNRETILDTPYQGQAILPLSETFAREDIDQLLAQDGCKGLRIYYGMDTNLKVHAILVGVTEANEDILPSTTDPSKDDIIVEESQRCPVSCPPASDLNT